MAPVEVLPALVALVCTGVSGFVATHMSGHDVGRHAEQRIPRPRRISMTKTGAAASGGRIDAGHGQSRSLFRRPWDVEVDFHGEQRVITVLPGDTILEAVSTVQSACVARYTVATASSKIVCRFTMTS